MPGKPVKLSLRALSLPHHAGLLKTQKRKRKAKKSLEDGEDGLGENDDDNDDDADYSPRVVSSRDEDDSLSNVYRSGFRTEADGDDADWDDLSDLDGDYEE